MSGFCAMPPALLCACLAVSLLFDAAGFLRMALLCSLVHEAGHVLAYVCCARRRPRLRPGLGGVALQGAQGLSTGQELAVLCAGPLANFLFAAVLYGCALHRARYGVYFLAAVSLCTGLYNLLPLHVLDGGRILLALAGPAHVGRVEQAQQALLAVFALVGVGVALCAPLPTAARVAALLAPGYLLAQQFFAP